MTEKQAQQAAADTLCALIRGINTRPSNADHHGKALLFLDDFYAWLLARSCPSCKHDEALKSP